TPGVPSRTSSYAGRPGTPHWGQPTFPQDTDRAGGKQLRGRNRPRNRRRTGLVAGERDRYGREKSVGEGADYRIEDRLLLAAASGRAAEAELPAGDRAFLMLRRAVK